MTNYISARFTIRGYYYTGQADPTPLRIRCHKAADFSANCDSPLYVCLPYPIQPEYPCPREKPAGLSENRTSDLWSLSRALCSYATLARRLP